MPDGEFHLEFTYTSDDFAETKLAATADALRKPVATYLRSRDFLLGCTSSIAHGIGFFLVLRWNLPLLPWLLIFGALWFDFLWQFHAAQRKEKRNAAMQQPKTMDIAERGVRLADALSVTEWRWEAFTELKETTNLFLLKKGDGTYLIIPKRGAPTGQLDAVGMLLAEHMHEPGAFQVLPAK